MVKESEKLVKITEISHRSFRMLGYQLLILKQYDHALYQKILSENTYDVLMKKFSVSCGFAKLFSSKN